MVVVIVMDVLLHRGERTRIKRNAVRRYLILHIRTTELSWPCVFPLRSLLLFLLLPKIKLLGLEELVGLRRIVMVSRGLLVVNVAYVHIHRASLKGARSLALLGWGFEWLV